MNINKNKPIRKGFIFSGTILPALGAFLLITQSGCSYQKSSLGAKERDTHPKMELQKNLYKEFTSHVNTIRAEEAISAGKNEISADKDETNILPSKIAQMAKEYRNSKITNDIKSVSETEMKDMLSESIKKANENLNNASVASKDGNSGGVNSQEEAQGLEPKNDNQRITTSKNNDTKKKRKQKKKFLTTLGTMWVKGNGKTSPYIAAINSIGAKLF